jgi:uncharacterized glyoxalase superfamily protein PhnB
VPRLDVVAICTRPRIASMLRFTASTPTPRIATEGDRDRCDHVARIDDLDLGAHAREASLPLVVTSSTRSRCAPVKIDPTFVRARMSSTVSASRTRCGARATAAWISARNAGCLPVDRIEPPRPPPRSPRAGYPAGSPRGKKGTRVNIKKVTPLLVVDRIEPSLRFYEKLGYTAVISVPHDDHLGFVLLAQDVGQIMLQTRSSLAADLPAISRTGVSSLLYVDVVSLEEALIAAAGSSEILVPMRTTAYGAREAFVREPSGQIVGFAEEVPKAD